MKKKYASIIKSFNLLFNSIVIVMVGMLILCVSLMHSTLLVILPIMFFLSCIAFLMVYRKKVYSTVVEIEIKDNNIVFKTIKSKSIQCSERDIKQIKPLFMGNGKRIELSNRKMLYINKDIADVQLRTSGEDSANAMYIHLYSEL